MESEKFPSPDDCDHAETRRDGLDNKHCVACGKQVGWSGVSYTNLPPRPRKALDHDWVLRVKDLKRIMARLPDDMPVVLSKDGEGNSYSPAAGYNDTYRAHEEDGSSRYVEIQDEDHDWDTDEPCDHKTCRYATGEPVLVLWPA